MKTRDSIIDASVPLRLGGRDYTMRYRAYAFIAYAEALDRDLLADIREIGRSVSEIGRSGEENAGIGKLFVRVRDVLWAGLIDDQPDLKREEVGRLFNVRDLNEITPAILGALRLSLPEAAPEAEARPTTAPARRRALRANGGLGSGASSAIQRELPPANS
jgi:hypothetical protein